MEVRKEFKDPYDDFDFLENLDLIPDFTVEQFDRVHFKLSHRQGLERVGKNNMKDRAFAQSYTADIYLTALRCAAHIFKVL